jgi:mannitol-1-phosphate/altronate dehydrogenase
MRPKAVIVGCGALGLGFVAERLAPDYDLCLVDVRAKEDLLRQIVQRQSFTVNLCGLESIQARTVAGTFDTAFSDAHDGDAALSQALAQADLVLTVTGRRLLDTVVSIIAPALNARLLPAWVLFCENGLNIAERYRQAFGSHVVLVDTVMSRMCRFDGVDGDAYRPIWPGNDLSLVVEDYSYWPLDATLCQGGPFSAVFSLVSPDKFLLWEDIKLYMHNGMHAFVAYRAHLEGIEHFADTPTRIRAAAREVMFTEVIPAIARTHACAARQDLDSYGQSLLSRFFSPFFNDSIERGARGIEEKLAPGERLAGGCAYIRRAGIEPVGYAQTIDVAKAILARRRSATETNAQPGPSKIQ